MNETPYIICAQKCSDEHKKGNPAGGNTVAVETSRGWLCAYCLKPVKVAW